MSNRPFKTEAVVFPATTCANKTYIKVGDRYYVSDYNVSESVAMKEINKRYLTKSFVHVENTTKITLSDGREFFHPTPATHDTMVFSVSDSKFIPIDVFDEMIENIPLAGIYED